MPQKSTFCRVVLLGVVAHEALEGLPVLDVELVLVVALEQIERLPRA
jgi:hypothetical protein